MLAGAEKLQPNVAKIWADLDLFFVFKGLEIAHV
jgi:hypothetical protein